MSCIDGDNGAQVRHGLGAILRDGTFKHECDSDIKSRKCFYFGPQKCVETLTKVSFYVSSASYGQTGTAFRNASRYDACLMQHGLLQSQQNACTTRLLNYFQFDLPSIT
jgi:SET domain-containing protein